MLSLILPEAVLVLPVWTRLRSDEGILKLRLNISGGSNMLSLITGMFIVVLVDPTAKAASIEFEE